MSSRLIIIFLCLLPLKAMAAHAVPPTQQSVDVFITAASLLPCQQNISAAAQDLGYQETAQTQIDTDYAEIEYSELASHSLLTLAVEDTPIGAQFSVTLDISETDQAYADGITTALRTSLSLPAPTQLQSLAAGSAQSWNTALPGGEAQIIVNHTDMNTQLIALMSPLTPGTQLPC